MQETVNFEAVVIGSGFGGTIAALTLAKYFDSKNQEQPDSPIKKVCILERGQWWISHELPYRTDAERNLETPNPQKNNKPSPPKTNMREYLQDKEQPFNFWAHPDNAEGMINWASKNRLLNKTGLYDYRLLSDEVHAVVASGVGGGSLVYSNVTLEPPATVYENKWPGEAVPPGQKPGPNSVSNFFPKAKSIIGVNKITTQAGLGPKTVKLDKTRVFQEAAHKARTNQTDFTIANPYDHNVPNPDPDLGFALDLSITDVSPQVFVNAVDPETGLVKPEAFVDSVDPKTGIVKLNSTLEQEVLKDSKQQNVCQRQGRCVLGCLPGSRHTLNKLLVNRLQTQTTKVLEVWALTEATKVELTETGNYRITYIRYDKDGTPSKPQPMETRILILAAGTLGTTELLLRSRSEKLPLSKRLGEGFSTDGDLLGFMKLTGQGPVTSVDNTRGPINTSHALFNRGEQFNFSIEDTTIPKMVAPLFATMLELYLEEIERGGILSKLKRAARLIRHFHLLGFLVAIFGFNIPMFQRRVTKLWNNKKVRDLLFALVKPIDPAAPLALTGPSSKTADRMAGLLTRLTKDYTTPNAAPEERLSKYFIFSCMGMDKANGTLRLRDPQAPVDKNHPDDLLELDWKPEENAETFDNIIRGMRQLAYQIDPHAEVHAPTWDARSKKAVSMFTLLHPLAGIHTHQHKQKPKKNERKPGGKNRSLVLLHPLGGCRIAERVEDGVVNIYGQVYKPNDPTGHYHRFYALDGAIVPTALGVNSSLTIAALALRGVKNLVEQVEEEYRKAMGQPMPVGFDGGNFWP